MLIDQDETLNEIMGTFIKNVPKQRHPYQNYSTNNYQKPPADKYDLMIRGIKMRNCNTLEGWQRDIVRNLDKKRDQYIIARPGGGKTLPIVCYWSNSLLGLNTTNRILDVRKGKAGYNIVKDALVKLFDEDQDKTEKMLVMVPVIALAQQTAAEFRRDLASVMMQYYNSNPSTSLKIFSRTNNRIKSIFREREKLVTIFKDPNNPNDNPRERLKGHYDRLESTFQNINKILVEEVVKHIVELVNRRVFIQTGESKSDKRYINEAIVFVTIYESASSLINEHNIKNLSLVVVDEAHLAQSSGIDIEDQSRSYQISGNLYQVFKIIKKHRNCRLVFLTGTINPTSAANMAEYLNTHFKRNFPKGRTGISTAPASAGNRSLLSVVVNESIRTDEGIVRNIERSVRQNDWGQLYVLFSTAGIANIVEMCIKTIGIRNIENRSSQGYEPGNVFSGLGRNRQGVGSIKLDDLDRLGIPRGMQMIVANITNPLLRQSVLRGVGFIHRKIPDDRFRDQRKLKMDDNDKMIVAKLFRERKLNVLLATDAVGIGVNIDVKELYIPSLNKFNKTVKGNVESSLRDLSQILNRAGRGATPIASIQTPRENVEMVNNALNANPDDFPVVGVHKRLRDRNKDKFHEYWVNLKNS